MQLIITFDGPEQVAIPVEYGYLLQGLIYKHIDNSTLRGYLHEQGFALGKRHFKLFTFSRLIGETISYDRLSRKLILKPPLKIVICSPMTIILQEIGTGLLRQGQVRLGDVFLEVVEMATLTPKVRENAIRVKMLSPMVVYSTFVEGGEKRYTYYYSPFEDRFNELIMFNLAKKYLLIYGKTASTEGFIIRPVKVGDKDHKITYYKGTWIKGWMGEYEISGDPKLLQVALDAGLGSKNSQGYGCCHLIG